MKTELLSRIEYLGERLPPNTLDQLIDDLGGPENVAEVWTIIKPLNSDPLCFWSPLFNYIQKNYIWNQTYKRYIYKNRKPRLSVKLVNLYL